VHRKPQGPGTRQQRLERIRRSHPIAREEPAMGCRRTNEIVAPVVRRSDNHVTSGKCLERVLKHGRRQVRAVAVERDDAPAGSLCEMPEHGGEARRKTVAHLRHDGCSFSRYARQVFYVGRWAHYGNVRPAE